MVGCEIYTVCSSSHRHTLNVFVDAVCCAFLRVCCRRRTSTATTTTWFSLLLVRAQVGPERENMYHLCMRWDKRNTKLNLTSCCPHPFY